MFANRNRAVQMQPGDGQLVIVRGRVSIYEARGEFQVIIDHMEGAGEGALRQAFDQLKVKLASEGLFDESRKTAIPDAPRHVALITSPTGAAIRDVLAVWKRRYPGMRITLVPVAVQGESAEADILQALAQIPRLNPDVVLLTRGGGSLEDLWTFNLESVARAVVDCPVPLVSAVGHEIDFAMTDFVADLRAPTPSAAAELMVPDLREIEQNLTRVAGRLRLDMVRRLEKEHLALRNIELRIVSPARAVEQASQRVDDLGNRLLMNTAHTIELHRGQLERLETALHSNGPDSRLSLAFQKLKSIHQAMHTAMHNSLIRRNDHLGQTARLLEGVSPLPTLNRGYAIVRDRDKTVVSTVAGLKPGTILSTLFADGEVESEVRDISTDPPLDQLL